MLRLVTGNPLITIEMVRRVPDAAAYAPVTVLIDERRDARSVQQLDRGRRPCTAWAVRDLQLGFSGARRAVPRL
jgi:hypothetical protein